MRKAGLALIGFLAGAALCYVTLLWGYSVWADLSGTYGGDGGFGLGFGLIIAPVISLVAGIAAAIWFARRGRMDWLAGLLGIVALVGLFLMSQLFF